MRLPVLAVALVSSAISDTAVAQSAPGNPMVQWYASEYGVAATEAEARLARLSSIAAVEKELQERFPNQFGGLYVQHSPQFRVVVKMTGAGQGLLQQVTSDPIYVVEQAERPLTQDMWQAMKRHISWVHSEIRPRICGKGDGAGAHTNG